MTPGNANGEFQGTHPRQISFDAVQLVRYSDMHKISQSVGRFSLPSTLQLLADHGALNLEHATSRYFSASADLDVSAWSAEGTAALERCGHCDNCLRNPTSYKYEDKTLEAWQVLRIAEEVSNLRGKVTVANLAALAGGNGKAKIKAKRGRGSGTEMELDVNRIAGGKAKLTVAVSHVSFFARPLN